MGTESPGAGSQSSSETTGTPKGSFEKQRGIIYDLISAGEIQGIVGGLSGVYFNDTAIVDKDTMASVGEKIGTCDANSSSTTISNATTKDGTGLFAGISTSDLTNNPRYLQVQGAGNSSTLLSAVSAGASSISVNTDNTFSVSMKQKIGFTNSQASTYDSVKYLVRIPGAKADGSEYRGIITNVYSTTGKTNNRATIQPAIGKAVASGTAVEVDAVIQITAINSTSSCTLASAPARSATGANCKLGQAAHSSVNTTTGPSKLNYASARATIYNGDRYQAAHDMPGTPAAASYVIGPNFNLKWHNSNDPGSGQATYFVSSSAFSFTQNSKEEVDRLKINIEFPAGLHNTTDEGKDRNAYAEFQLVLEYKQDANAGTFTKILAIGKDYGGADFDQSVPAWSTTYKNQRDILYSGNGTRQSNGLVRRVNQTVKFIQEFEIDLKPFQPLADWRIGIKRLSPDSTADYTVDQHNFVGPTTVKTVEAIIEEKLRYPLSAYGVVEFSAEDFGSPPKRAYHIRGRKVKVPSNYITREESGSNTAKYTRNVTTGADTGSYVSWNGTFRGDLSSSAPAANKNKVYTNNPAWIFYDLLIDKEIGLGNFIKETDIDKYALYQIARYCDELVPDGKGGQEPRFSCNVYFTKQEESYKVLKDLASVFRGMMYWIDGSITPIQDRFREPVYTFTNGNVEEGMFNYTYTGQRARVNQINVSWSNPDENFKQTVLTIDDTANILDQERIVSKDVVAFGCTSEAQAQRVGQWHLITDTEETEVVGFTTGVNATFLRPGDFINIQDHYADGIEASGRVNSTSNTTHDFGTDTISTHEIVLDREVTLSGYSVAPAVGSSPESFSHVIYLIYPESGTYLDQDQEVIINSVTYSERGALILSDANGAAITTLAQASNLVDDSGNPVIAQFSKNSRIEKHYVMSKSDSNGRTSIKSRQPFTSLANSDVIWAIGPTEEYSTPDIKQYRILGITEEEEGEKFAISASVVAIDKYDNIENNRQVYVPDYSQFSGILANVPYPTNLSVQLVPTASASIDGADSSVEAIISWTSPEESFTDSSGTASDVPYRFVSRYEIQHDLKDGDLDGGLSNLTVAGNASSVRIPNVSAGKYQIKIRTVSDVGTKSVWNTINRTVTSPPPNLNRITRIPRGGTLTTSLEFDYTTGKMLFEDSDFSYVAPSSYVLGITSATTAQKEVNFSAMSNNTTAYLYYDHNVSSNAAPWKTVQVHTDATATDIGGQAINFNYFREVSATNNGLSSTSGTVSVSLGGTLVTGSSTTFTSDFAEGDLIKITTGSAPGTEVATSEYFEVAEVIDNTSLYLKRSPARAFSGAYAMKQSLKPNFAEDAILAVVQKGATGDYAAEIFLNAKGKRGAGRWQVPVTSLPTTSAAAQTAWDTNWTNRPGNPVVGDQAIFFEGTEANQTAQGAWTYDGATWQQQAEVIDGDLVVTGSITTDKIFANAITAEKIAANQITANEITTNSIQAIHVSADAINANHIAAGEITTAALAADAITADKIAAGAVTADSVAANSVVATLLDATSVTASDITTTSLSALSANLGNITAGTMKNSGANSIPDANSAPSGNEKGAHIDLDAGKFVFGSASKHILWDGTDLTLSGVVVDSTSTVNTSAGLGTVKEDGTTDGTNITSLDFTTGLNVAVTGSEATIHVDATTSNISEGTRLYFTNARADARVNAVLPDTDSLSEGSSNLYYTTSRFNTDFGNRTTSNLSEGTNQYFTQARVRTAISGLDNGGLGSFSYSSSNGQFTYTGPSNADIRGLFSHSDAGGDGSFSYNSSTGVFTYTGPSAAEVRAHFAGGNGLTLSSGTFAVGQGDGISVAADSVAVDSTVVRTSGTQTINGNKTFGNNVTVSGDLTVSGTTTTINTETVNIADNVIVLNSNFTGSSPTENAGIEVERGTQSNKTFIWKESNDRWSFGSESVEAATFYGSFIGSITGSPSSLAGLSTDDLAEGSTNLYFTNSRARAAISGGNGLGYDSSTGVMSVNAGSGISISSDQVNVSGVTTAMLAGASFQTSGEAFSDSDSVLMSAAAVNDRIQAFGYTTNVGDITAVTIGAGSGLTGGGTGSSGAVSLTLNVGAGSGISVAADSVAVDSTVLRTNANATFTGQLTMGTQKALIASDYGHGVYGVYSPTRYQHVWSMGTSYNLPSNGYDESGAAGNLYGLAWSYNPNYSYSGSNPQAKSGLGHQLLLMMNGTTRTALGTGIWTDGTITTTSHGTSANWNTAYGWGNHASAGYLTSLGSAAYIDTATGNYGTVKVDDDRGVTWAGYAIRDDWVFMSSGVNAAGIYNDTDNEWHIYTERNSSVWLYFNGAGRIQTTSAGATVTGVISATGGNSTNWNTAYGWGNHASAGYITGNQTITLSGDVSGSGTTSISVTVADDSHNHVISNVDGLQTALDSKLTGNQTITLSGDATGSGTTSIAVSLAANSVGASEIAANAVGASELNVSGNGSAGQALLSDGDGTFSWGSAGTTYSAGSGIGLSGTTFSVAAGAGLTQDANGLSLTNNCTGDWFIENLTATTIDACHITASTITARELTISANSDSTASSMFFNNNGSIRIYDGSSVLRVKIGNLA